MLPPNQELVESLEKMVENISIPKNQKRFAKYNKTLQFEFTDDEEAVCHIVFRDGTATIVYGMNENAELKITTTTETIMAIIGGTLSPTRAFMTGKLKAQGPPNDLMKLQALMK